MNSQVSRLEPIAEYAGKVEAQAARQLAASAKALRDKEHELEQLRSYLAEYRQREAPLQDSTNSLRWQNSRTFLAKLSAAVAAHETELQKAVEAYRVQAERWRESLRRARSLDHVVERGRRAHDDLLRRRAEAELDEHALRRVLAADD